MLFRSKQDPDVGSAPLVCDCSSDFLSRPIDVQRHGLIYACAQKNAGIAGVTAVIIRRDLLDRCRDDLPTMLDTAPNTSVRKRRNLHRDGAVVSPSGDGARGSRRW